jgi:2-isopropylmalate synthase
MKNIKIQDITLKKLSEDREVALLFREKTAIAACADSIGADVIELAPVKNPREDAIIYKTIAQNVQNAIVAIPVGFSVDDVKTAWDCIKDAKNPRLQIELPISTVLMEYTYHVKAEKMLSKIVELIKAAKELCSDVEFTMLDATRADADFIVTAAKEAASNGATVITICDDAGISLPEEIAQIVATVKNEVNVPVYVQVSDRINMAVASAIASVKNGADGLKCAMAGKDVLLTGKIADINRLMEFCNEERLGGNSAHRRIGY